MATVNFTHGRRFDPTTGEVLADGRRTRLEPQPAALLVLLIERAGTLVSHEEIRRRLWGDGRNVEYAAGLHYAVRQIRRALGGDGGDIETIPRRGYRLRAEAVDRNQERPPAPRDGRAVGPPDQGRQRAVVAWAMVAAVTAALVAIVEGRPNDHHAQVVALLRAVHDLLY